jgi:transcriptional regulator with XRE-family HTH domain
MRTSRHEVTPQTLRQLGDFLRAKRRQVAPEEHGLATTRRRLVPGLSRDETATLADIGASWYARLEAGRVERPTLETMLAIARALRLDIAETTYVLKLAGLVPSGPDDDADVLLSVTPLFHDGDPISFSLWDHFLLPIGWNAVANAMYGFSAYSDPVLRHPLTHLDDPKMLAFFGDFHEAYARNLVGMFRRVYDIGEPSAVAQAVFQRVRDIPIFKRYWDQHVVSDHTTDPSAAFTRNHWIVGTYVATSTDLLLGKERLLLRVVAPADEASRDKFERLRALGQSRSPARSSLVGTALS